MKKIMWAGVLILIIGVILVFLLVFLQQPIPDLVMILIAGGILTVFISSIFVARENRKQLAFRMKQTKR